MKQIAHETISTCNQTECAGEILNTIPLIMVSMRTELRRRRPLFSMPQFRILRYLALFERPTLSDLAEHIGLRHPTMSKMVDGMVQRGWVARDGDAADRRRIRLDLTAQGRKEFRTIHGEMRQSLAGMLNETGAADQQTIYQAMQILQEAFRRENEKAEEGKMPDPAPAVGTGARRKKSAENGSRRR